MAIVKVEQLEGWVVRGLMVWEDTTSTGGGEQFCEGILEVELGVDEGGLGDGSICIGMRTVMLFEWLDPFLPLAVAARQRWQAN